MEWVAVGGWGSGRGGWDGSGWSGWSEFKVTGGGEDRVYGVDGVSGWGSGWSEWSGRSEWQLTGGKYGVSGMGGSGLIMSQVSWWIE